MLPFQDRPPRPSFAAAPKWLMLAALLLVSAAPPAQQARERPQVGVMVDDYRVKWNRGEYAEALVELNSQMERMTRGVPPRYLYDRAQLHFTVGHHDAAIRDMEILCRQISTPVFTLTLAEYYRAVGREDLFRGVLTEASMQARNRWFYGAYEDNVIAAARIAELQGDNPRNILKTILDPLIHSRPDFAGGYLAAGELALRKRDFALAAEYLLKALELDDENQAALAALMRCYFESNDPRFAEVREHLTELNPAHPEAAAILAEFQIMRDNLNQALEIVDGGLSVNPAQPQLLALKSAALYLLDRPEEMEAVQRHALMVNPRNSEIFRTTGRLVSFRIRPAEGAAFQRRALEIDPDDHEAAARLGFDLLNLGRDAEGKAQLEQAFKADPFSVPVYNMLRVLDAMEQFETVERGPFRLSLVSSESPVLQEDVFRHLEAAARDMGERYAIEYETPIAVQLFDDHGDFMVRTFGFPGAWQFLGICTGQLITMPSPSALPPGVSNWHETLWHEFAHVVTLQKTGNRISRWLSEGISVYEQGLRDPAWPIKLNPQYKLVLAEQGTVGLRNLESFFVAPRSDLHLSFGYFISGEFVRFFVEAYGFAALVEALDLIGSGVSSEVALARASGREESQIDEGFADYLNRRLSKLENLPPIVKVERTFVALNNEGEGVTMSAYAWGEDRSRFADAMKSAKGALDAENWSMAEIYLKRAHELFPEMGGIDSPLRLLMDLYERQDRQPELRQALRNQLSIHSSDRPSARRYVEMLEAESDWAAAAMEAERAYGVDPFDPRLRRVRARAAARMGQTDVALAEYARLILIDPAARPDYELQRVETLIAAERWDEARDEVFELLERMPYFWDAQRALLRIVERDEPRRTAAGDAREGRDAARPMAGL